MEKNLPLFQAVAEQAQKIEGRARCREIIAERRAVYLAQVRAWFSNSEHDQSKRVQECLEYGFTRELILVAREKAREAIYLNLGFTLYGPEGDHKISAEYLRGKMQIPTLPRLDESGRLNYSNNWIGQVFRVGFVPGGWIQTRTQGRRCAKIQLWGLKDA